jgi:hypothetical protein
MDTLETYQAVLRGNPISMERMMTVLLRHFPLGGINLGGVHRHEGPVVGLLEVQCLSLAHRQPRILAAWHNGVSTADVT